MLRLALCSAVALTLGLPSMGSADPQTVACPDGQVVQGINFATKSLVCVSLPSSPKPRRTSEELPVNVNPLESKTELYVNVPVAGTLRVAVNGEFQTSFQASGFMGGRVTFMYITPCAGAFNPLGQLLVGVKVNDRVTSFPELVEFSLPFRVEAVVNVAPGIHCFVTPSASEGDRVTVSAATATLTVEPQP